MDNPIAHINTYELRHLVAHLEASGRSADIHALLRLEWEQAEEVSFRQQGSKARRQNAWYAAKEGSGDTNGYLADLDAARRLADSAAAARSAKRPEAVALQCLYALIAAVIRDLARNHLPSLAARYVQAGIWTRDQALTWARLNPDQQLGLQIVQDALHKDKGEGRDELGRLALSTAATIPDSDNRVLAVVGFSGDLPTHLMHAAFEIVVKEPNEGSRLGGLTQIVRKLPKDLQLEALEVAKRFEQPELKAEAIAIVADALDEPERTEAFHASFAVIREAIALRKANKGISFSPEKLARTLPLEWLDELIKVLDLYREDHLPELQSALASGLERLADQKPDWVWKQLVSLPSWHHDEVLSRVAVALAAKGSSQKALTAAAGISSDFGNRKTNAIIAILKMAPESEWNRCIELFSNLSTENRIFALKVLAASPEVPVPLLLRLTDTLSEEWDHFEACAAIAYKLTAVEFDEIFNACLACANDSLWSRIMVDLAPYLSVAQTLQALDELGKRRASRQVDTLKALVARLADLGEPIKALNRVSQLDGILEWVRAEVLVSLAVHLPDQYLSEVLNRVSQLDGILESTRAENLASLAVHLPDQYLSAVLSATRPARIAAERVRTRAELIPWLPHEIVKDIVSEACGLTEFDSLERIRVLSEITPILPVEYLYNLDKVLIASLQLVVTARDIGWRKVMRQGFRALSQVLNRYPSAEMAEQAMALAQDEELPSAEQITLLVDLASAGGTASHVRAALATAIQIAAHDLELTSILSERLSADHKLALTDLLGEQDEPWQLIAFLDTVAHLLDDTARHKAYQCVSAIDDFQMRLAGLYILLPYLGRLKRRKAILTEMARKSEWSQEPEAFVYAIAVLAPHAPDVVRPHVKNLVAVFGKLGRWTKVALAGPLMYGTDFAQEIIDEAIAALDDLPEPERPDAIAQLASLLDPLQIAHVMSWLMVHQDLDMVSALSGLIRRAAALDDYTLVLELLGVPENEVTRSKLIEETASELPLEALALAAALIKHDPYLGHGTLVVRAAELGDMHLALLFLDQKGSNTFSGDRTLERVYQLAPNSWVNVLITYAEKLSPWKRALALLQLINKIPHNQRRPLVELIVGSATSQRLDVIHALEPELCRLPTSAVVSMWTDATRRSSEGKREDALLEVRAFARTLVSRLGPEIALKLDEAIRLSGGEGWP